MREHGHGLPVLHPRRLQIRRARGPCTVWVGDLSLPFACASMLRYIFREEAIASVHLPLDDHGASRGYGVIDLDRVRVSPEDWRQFGSPFADPPQDLAIEFPDIRILDENSCSACQSTLLLFLKRYGDSIFEYFPADEEVTIGIGKGVPDVPPGTLCIGNCMRAHKDAGPYVPGCPPVGSEILKKLSGKTSVDTLDGRGETPGMEK